MVASGSADELPSAEDIWQSYKSGYHHHTDQEPKHTRKTFVQELNKYIELNKHHGMKKPGEAGRPVYYEVKTE